jgi:hypothetical protein
VNWVGRACWWPRPLAELLLGSILSSPKIFADDTPVLDPGRGRTKTGRLWSYARDDRPWQGPLPPAVAYVEVHRKTGAIGLPGWSSKRAVLCLTKAEP